MFVLCSIWSNADAKPRINHKLTHLTLTITVLNRLPRGFKSSFILPYWHYTPNYPPNHPPITPNHSSVWYTPNYTLIHPITHQNWKLRTECNRRVLRDVELDFLKLAWISSQRHLRIWHRPQGWPAGLVLLTQWESSHWTTPAVLDCFVILIIFIYLYIVIICNYHIARLDCETAPNSTDWTVFNGIETSAA